MRVAINGFGRIGRLALRAALEAKTSNIEFVAINDLGDSQTNAHLLRYDSTHAQLPFEVELEGDKIQTQGQTILCISQRDPAQLPWRSMEVDLVLECTGLFTARKKAADHLSAGAKKVLVSGPSNDADYTIVLGVNDQGLKASHQVISNASCTTNCLAPVAAVLNQHCGIARGHMTTVHAFTGDQSVLDIYHADKRRARASALSMIPTSTGAAKAIALVMPELAGKIAGTAIRVPTPNVSLIDLVIQTEKNTDINAVNQAFLDAARGRLKGILEVNQAPLVSCDFNHSTASAIVDLELTNVMDGQLVRILAWYDNEWGFANRMVDVAKKISTLL